jgi:hypothetical protein
MSCKARRPGGAALLLIKIMMYDIGIGQVSVICTMRVCLSAFGDGMVMLLVV